MPSCRMGCATAASPGKNLTDYISGGNSDYQNARKIINGLDQAILIKGYADDIEFLLRFCNGVK